MRYWLIVGQNSLYQGRNDEARWGLQPRRLRFVSAIMPANLQNVTDGITNPVRLRKCANLPTEARQGLQPSRLRFVSDSSTAKPQNVTDGITNPVRLRSFRFNRLCSEYRHKAVRAH